LVSAILTLLYVIVGRLGLSLAFVHASATAVWPPTGFALAYLLFLGYGYWPSIFLGAFCVNYFISNSLGASLGIATGNTLEAVSAVYLLNHFIKGRFIFEKPNYVVRYIIIAGFVSTAVSATIGVISLCIFNLASWDQFSKIWITWWTGDCGGALIVAPVLITSFRNISNWFPARGTEFLLLIGCIFLNSLVVFSGLVFPPGMHYPLGFSCLPIILWAAFRFGPKETVLAVFILAVIAVVGTLKGYGPFSSVPLNESLVLLQGFLGTISIVGMMVSAAWAEQQRVEAMLRSSQTHLTSMQKEAAEASKLKDDFVANLSHELRTPLNAILGWAQMLQRTELDDAKKKEGLAVIERNARVQARLISDLLDISRIISGKMRLDKKITDLSVVVNNSIQVVQAAAKAKNIRIETKLTSGIFVFGDASRLQQIYWNILSNAVKFTPPEGVIKVNLSECQEGVKVEITDSGQGIMPEFLPHIFIRFHQADSSTTRRFGGLGLGLSIVQELVSMHDGVVSAFSDGEGKGATFTVVLPQVAKSKMEVVQKENNELNKPDFSKLKILVVDDEFDARTLIKQLLEDYHAEVFTAASAAEALEIFKQDKPNLLISDIGMPVEDGYDLIQRVRKFSSSEGGSIPAIALTAFARTQDRTQALESGYQVHLTKPLEADSLIRSISDLMA